MTSLEALERIKSKYKGCLVEEAHNLPFSSDINIENIEEYWHIENKNDFSQIEKDLEIVECFRKIPKQDLKEFIDWQIRYEKNMNTWLEGCNCDLGQEDPTKHLIKIKEWLEE